MTFSYERRMGYEVRGLQRSRSFSQSKISFLLENPFWKLPMLSARIICRKGTISSSKPKPIQMAIPLSVAGGRLAH
ncbi:MAG: hypothetical protein O6846_01825 [Thaumarchaeota archaeon]|nr:hypothetical protein [Nitrososphaerota archaeon]